MMNRAAVAGWIAVAIGTLGSPVAGQVGKPVMPTAFEPNRGQAAKEFEFIARGLGYAVGLTGTQARIMLGRGPGLAPETVSLTLVHAKQRGVGQPVDKLKSINSYYSGQTSITGIPTFEKVRYDGVWPGVDVLYYGTGQQLEYDFIVAPHANPKLIQMRFDGVQSKRKTPEGDLILKTGTSELVEAKPTAYQLNGSNRTPVVASYRIGKGSNVTIELGDYDHSKQLVIDPIIRYLFNKAGQSVNGLSPIDASAVASFGGNTIVVGWTQSNCAGCSVPFSEGIVSVIDASGHSPLYQSAIGATDGNVYPTGVAVDASGNIYVTGVTDSAGGFPLVNAFQATSGGGQDAFLTKFSPNLGAALYSTYLGGNVTDNASGLAASGSIAYVVGLTNSTNFPVASPPAGQNGFVYALDTSKTGSASKVYGLPIGGSGTDSALGVAADSSSNVYVGGATTSLSSTFLPTIGAASFLNTKSTTANDGFLVKLNSSGTLTWGTFFLGGAVQAVALSGTQVAIAGQTTGAITTTSGGYQLSGQGANGNVGHGFVAKLDTAQSGVNALLYSTYLGGTGTDGINGVAIGTDNNVYVAGVTSSSNFPTAGTPPPLQATYVGGALNEDGFLSVLNPALSGSAGLVYSTFLGAAGSIVATGIALDGFNYNQPAVSATTYVASGMQNIPQIGSIIKLGTFGPTNVGIFRFGFFWLLDVDGNQAFNMPPDQAFPFGGIAGDIPITGDWNGDGHTKVGIYRPGNGLFILDSNGNGVFDSGDAVYNLGVGTQPADLPVVGDWNGDGRTKVGLFRQGFFWILDYNGDGVFEQGTDKTYAFGGVAGDVPVVGDWTGTGTSKIGLVRYGYFWILDANGNGTFDGTSPGIPPYANA